MLEMDLNLGNNQFLQCLNQDAEVPSGNAIKEGTEHKIFFDVLNKTDQDVASDAAEFLMTNGVASKQKTPCLTKIQKVQKPKRRKLK